MTNGTTPSGEPVEAADSAPERVDAGGRTNGVAVRLAESELVIPEECACCGAPPTRTIREAHVTGRTAFVPYCAECHAHVSKEATRQFSMSLSAGIVAFTLAAGLPLVWQPSAPISYALLVLVGGLTPILLGAQWPRRREAGHASSGRAALFRFGGVLSCARSEWGESVARMTGVGSSPARFREPRVPPGSIAALVVGCALLPVYYRMHFPPIRVVNLTDERLDIAVDGRVRRSVPPTSAESTGAGVELRVAAGRRLLSARNAEGRIVDSATVSVRSGAQHLYAPASEAYCFWIETTGYGRNKGLGTHLEPLSGPPRFWALENAIDLWFSPTPDADFDERSTGGFLRAVRQARCEAVPGPVRRGENSPAPAFATGVE